MSSFRQPSNLLPIQGSVAPAFSLVSLLKLSLALCILSQVMDGFLPQLQIAVFGGSTPIPAVLPLMYLIACATFLVLIRPQPVTSPLIVPAMVLLTFLVLDSAHLHFVEELGVGEIFFKYLTYFLILMVAITLSAFPLEISEGVFTTLILICFWANFAVAFMQFITNTPVLATSNANQTFVVHSSTYAGGLQRAFGFFSDGMDLGLFCSFVAALGTRYCRTFIGSIWGIIIIAAAVFVCYATYTRLAFVCCACSIFSAFVFSNRSLRRWALWLPLVWLLFGGLITYQALTSNRTYTSLSSTDSMNSRYAGWMEAVGNFSSADLEGKILGIGMVPNPERNLTNQPTKVANYPIDNVFFILLIYIGIAGVAIVAYIVIRIWLYIYNVTLRDETDLKYAIAAFWSTILLTSLFNFTLISFSRIFLIFILLPREQETLMQAKNPSLL